MFEDDSFELKAMFTYSLLSTADVCFSYYFLRPPSAYYIIHPSSSAFSIHSFRIRKIKTWTDVEIGSARRSDGRVWLQFTMLHEVPGTARRIEKVMTNPHGTRWTIMRTLYE